MPNRIIQSHWFSGLNQLDLIGTNLENLCYLNTNNTIKNQVFLITSFFFKSGFLNTKIYHKKMTKHVLTSGSYKNIKKNHSNKILKKIKNTINFSSLNDY